MSVWWPGKDTGHEECGRPWGDPNWGKYISREDQAREAQERAARAAARARGEGDPRYAYEGDRVNTGRRRLELPPGSDQKPPGMSEDDWRQLRGGRRGRFPWEHQETDPQRDRYEHPGGPSGPKIPPMNGDEPIYGERFPRGGPGPWGHDPLGGTDQWSGEYEGDRAAMARLAFPRGPMTRMGRR